MLTRRRALRGVSTDAERVLWAQLRAKRLLGFKFRRQHPCGPYILDFYCAASPLAVELDGGQHFESAALDYDRRRTAFLLRRGIRVLRFPTDLVFREPIAVLDAIIAELRGLPSPRSRGERGPEGASAFGGQQWYGPRAYPAEHAGLSTIPAATKAD